MINKISFFFPEKIIILVIISFEMLIKGSFQIRNKGCRSSKDTTLDL